MPPVRCSLLAVILALAGCSREPVDSGQTLTGSDAAVAGLPRYHRTGRFEVESCCTFQFGSGVRSKRLQGVDSSVHEVSGPGYVLHIVFGPYDTSQPQPGYRAVDKRTINDVMLTGFRWTDRNRKPPEGRLIWLARVGGGKIEGVNHAPWGLRIMSDCVTPAGCRGSTELVDTARF